MSDDPMQIDVPTSPELPADSGLMRTEKQFSGAMTLDLTDDQIAAAIKIVHRVRSKHMEIFRRKFNDPSSFKLDDALKAIEHFEDELKTELAEKVNVLASVNTVPLLEGQPMEIEWLGVLPGGSLDKYGQDHERKTYEVKKATERGEDYLGQKK